MRSNRESHRGPMPLRRGTGIGDGELSAGPGGCGESRRARRNRPETGGSANTRNLPTRVPKVHHSRTTRGPGQEAADEARETTDQPVPEYVLLKEAGRLAVESGQYRLAMEILDDVDEGFVVNGLKRKTNLLEKLRGAADAPAGELTLATLNVMAHAVAEERYDAAVDLGVAALAAARQANDKALIEEIERYQQRLRDFLNKPARERAIHRNPFLSALSPYDCRNPRGVAQDVMLRRYGGNRESEAAVAAALVWLARHQLADGSWSLDKYTDRCNNKSCTGPGRIPSDVAATAFGLLPFLAAGQTHKAKGPYRQNIDNGLAWLIKHQKADGDLAAGAAGNTDVCPRPGDHRAVRGLRHDGRQERSASRPNRRSTSSSTPRTSRTAVGDTPQRSTATPRSSVGRSGPEERPDGRPDGGPSPRRQQVARLGGDGGKQLPVRLSARHGSSNTMTAVGLLCRRYLGTKLGSRTMQSGIKYLTSERNLPDLTLSNIYYWYYAAQVMHHATARQWAVWNRKLREPLIASQCKDATTCACGSWDPKQDAWGAWRPADDDQPLLPDAGGLLSLPGPLRLRACGACRVRETHQGGDWCVSRTLREALTSRGGLWC